MGLHMASWATFCSIPGVTVTISVQCGHCGNRGVEKNAGPGTEGGEVQAAVVRAS